MCMCVWLCVYVCVSVWMSAAGAIKFSYVTMPAVFSAVCVCVCVCVCCSYS